MKNQIKKTLAGLAVVAVIVSGASVFAAQTVTDSGYWRQSFDDLKAHNIPNDMYISANSVELTDDGLAQLGAEGVFLGGKTGISGNAGGFFAAENLKEAAVLGAVDSTVDTSLKKASGLAATRGGLTATDAHIGFEAMVKDFNTTRKITVAVRQNSKASNATDVALLTINTDGTAKVGEATYTMPASKWVRFDFYTVADKDATESEIIFYADGQLIGTGTVKAGTSKKWYGIKSVESVKVSLAAGETGFYMDNLTVDKKTAPEGGFALGSEKAEIDNDHMAIAAPVGTTAADFTGAEITIVASDGTVQQSAQQDGFVIAKDGYSGGNIYYTLTVEGTPEPAEDAVELTVTSDSGYYADTADGADKSGVVGFKTSIEKTGDPVMQNYGTFLLKSSDFDAAAGTQTEVANAGDLESGKAYVVEVENIGEADFGTAIYAKSFVQTADGYFYSDVISNMVGANGKWLGAK